MSEPVILGRINGLFGTHGWVKAFSFTRPPDNLFQYDPWLLRKGSVWKPYKILATKCHRRTLIARLDGVCDRTDAAELLRSDIGVRRAQLPLLSDDEFYWASGRIFLHRGLSTLGSPPNYFAVVSVAAPDTSLDDLTFDGAGGLFYAGHGDFGSVPVYLGSSTMGDYNQIRGPVGDYSVDLSLPTYGVPSGNPRPRVFAGIAFLPEPSSSVSMLLGACVFVILQRRGR